MLGRHLRTTAACLIAGVMLVAACGDESGSGGGSVDDPEEAVLAAFSAIDTDATEMTITFDGDAAELAAALETMDDTFPADEPGTDTMVELMAGAELRASASGEDFAMAVALDDTALTEMRVIGSTIYGRIDFDSALALIGDIDPEAAAEFEMIVGMAPMIAAEDPRLGFVQDLLEGRWISMEVPDDAEYSDLFDATSDTEAIDEEMLSVIEEILSANTAVTHVGDARGGQQFVIEVDVASTMAALARNPMAAQALDLTDSTTDTDELVEQMQSEGMASSWEFDVVVTDGVVSSVGMDLATLSTEAPDGASLPVLIRLSPSPSAPEAPGDHTPIPPELLEELAGDMMGGLGPMGDPAGL